MIGFIAGTVLLMAFIGLQASFTWCKKRLQVFRNERR